MKPERSLTRYRAWYGRLLRLYPRAYRQRFGEGMEQTFSDLLREHAGSGRSLITGALWLSLDTVRGILRENLTMLLLASKPVIRLFLAVVLLLLIPAVAMRFTDEVNWGPGDFALMGALLFGTGLAYLICTRKGGNVAYRAGTGLALGTALFLIWANLAVGIIGSEDHPANLMYAGVLAVALGGAFLARLQPLGLSRALFATAFTQAAVGLIALSFGLPSPWFVHALFVGLWGTSGLLFLFARRRPAAVA